MKSRIYMMLLGVAVFNGITFHLAKLTVRYFSVFSVAALRFSLAAVIMLGIVGLQKNIKWDSIKKNCVAYMILGIVGIFGFNALFFWGMKYTSQLNAALIMATNPLVTTLFSYILLKAPISRRQKFGIFIALLGVIIVITQGRWEVMQTASFSKGDILIVLGNVCWALYGVFAKKYLKNSTPIETTTYSMVIGAIGLMGLAIFLPQPLIVIEAPVSAWNAILFMAIFTSVLGYLWWNKAIEIIGTVNTSLFFNLVPIVTMIISILNGTSITLYQTLGTILVLVGVISSTGKIKFFNIRPSQIAFANIVKHKRILQSLSKRVIFYPKNTTKAIKRVCASIYRKNYID